MKVPNTNENMEKCICGSCPTFTDNSLKGGFFLRHGEERQSPRDEGMHLWELSTVGRIRSQQGLLLCSRDV